MLVDCSCEGEVGGHFLGGGGDIMIGPGTARSIVSAASSYSMGVYPASSFA